MIYYWVLKYSNSYQSVVL